MQSAATAAPRPAGDHWSAAFLSLGLLLVAFSITLAVKSYTPLPIWDHWIFYLNLANHSGLISPTELWAQHNEHRPLLLRLFCLADYAWFSGTGVFLYLCLFLSQLGNAALLIWIAHRFTHWRRDQLWVWAGLVLALLFTPSQRENFTWAWQLGFLTPLLASTAAVAALLSHTAQWRTHHRRWTLAFTFVLLFGVIGWLFLAAGLVVVVLLPLLAWWLRTPRANILVLALAALGGALLYFSHYAAPVHHISPAVSLTQHLDRVLLFVLTNLGGLTNIGLGKSLVLPTITGLAGLLVWAFVLRHSLHVRTRTETPLFPAAMLFFTTMAAVILLPTATARIAPAGYEQIVSRYQSIAVFFWLGLAGYVMDLWRERQHRWLWPAAITLALAMFPFVTTRELLNEERQREQDRSRMAMAVASDVDEVQIFPVLLPHGDDWEPWRNFALNRHLSLFTDPFYRLLQAPLSTLPASPLRGCAGGVDRGSIEIVGHKPHGLYFTGWAWDPDLKKPVADLLIIDEQNRIAGYGQTSVHREDVPPVVPTVTNDRVGWQGYANIALSGKPVRVIGLQNRAVACQVGPAVTLTPAR